MVKINTRDFGELEVSEEDIFTFPAGVFAFEETRHFALISPLGDDVYPKWLQSTDALTPCFIVFDPSIIDEGYNVSFEPNDYPMLKIRDGTNVRLLVIATVPENYKKTTVNMKSPIVINIDAKLAAQVILQQNYEFRLPIYVEEECVEEGAG